MEAGRRVEASLMVDDEQAKLRRITRLLPPCLRLFQAQASLVHPAGPGAVVTERL